MVTHTEVIQGKYASGRTISPLYILIYGRVGDHVRAVHRCLRESMNLLGLMTVSEMLQRHNVFYDEGVKKTRFTEIILKLQMQ